MKLKKYINTNKQPGRKPIKIHTWKQRLYKQRPSPNEIIFRHGRPENRLMLATTHRNRDHDENINEIRRLCL